MNDVIWGGITVKALLGIVGGGLGISVVAQIIKRVFKLTSAKVIQFLVVALSGVASGLVYVIETVHGNPALALGHATSLLGVANAVHTFIVSDADKFVSKVKQALASEGTQSIPLTAAPDATSVATSTPAGNDPAAATTQPATASTDSASF